MHSLREAAFERNLQLPSDSLGEIDYIGFGSYGGKILIKVTGTNPETDSSDKTSTLFLYSRNGKFLSKQDMEFYLHDIYLSRLNDWIVTITDGMKIIVHDGHSLQPMTIFTLGEQIYNLSFNKKELAAFGGTEKGHLFILYSSSQ